MSQVDPRTPLEVKGRDHGSWRILEKIARTDEEQARGLLALRRAITARRICADGLLETFVASKA